MPAATPDLRTLQAVLSGSLLLLLASCNGETTIKETNDAPEITMLAPEDGGVFDEGALITFNAVVEDDDQPETITVRWTTNQNDGQLLYTGLADSEGRSTFDYSELPVGIHKITATAIDPDGATGASSHYIEISDVADAPTIAWNHPVSGEFGIETQDFEFSVIATDEQDDEPLLQVFLSSDLDGEFCAPPPDQVGYAVCTASLSGGQHTLTATVIDQDGNQATKEAFFEVMPASGQDFDGDGWTGDQGDCNDEDPSVFPNATEVANGVDDDCDGTVDDDTSAFDDDGDCFCELGPCAGSAEPACTALAGSDCDDEAAGVYPTAAETCDGADEDCDGAIDEDTPCVDDDADGYTELAGDCNDADGTVRPGAPEVADGIDQDCDGQVDDGTSAFDDDGDCYCESGACTGSIDGACGAVNPGDCDDNDDQISPAEAERCDSVDNNCDGQIDEATATDAASWYQDSDADLWGNASVTQRACTQPAGYVSNSSDCNDGSSAVFPGAVETCNTLDDDCDGATDEPGATGGPTTYQDGDSDGYGNAAVISTLCTPPAGYVSNATDCNDGNSAVFPGATEYCNSADDDCDGTIDENSAADALTWYRDTDGDGYGGSATTALACTMPAGYVSTSTDCNDSDASIKPGAAEVCDGIDQDCDGSVDEGAQLTWYRDADGDSYGTPSTTSLACTQPSGYVANDDDCNDASASINPATVWYADSDGDGYGGASTTTGCTQPAGYLATSTDCNDSAASAHPGAAETCDSVDNDCDGSTDEQNATGCTTYYYDGDGDNYGTGSGRCYCNATGYYTSTNNSDCYDSNASAYPSASTYYTTNRGDGSFDYNCSGSNDRRYTATYSCIGAVYICTSYSAGFTSGSVPTCGNSGNWRDGCSASLTSCTYSTSSARTQTCR